MPGAEHDAQIAALRNQPGEQRFSGAWAKGQAMTLEQAIAFAPEKTHD